MPSITTAPTAPSRFSSTPAAFVTQADAFMAWLEAMPVEFNTAAAEIVALVSGIDFNGTSTTSNTVGTGSKTWTTQSGKLWQVGQFVIVADSASPANYCYGQVTAYANTTLTVNVTATGGSGTKTSWAIGLAPIAANYATLAGSETLTNKTVALGSNTVSGTLAEFNTACSDANFASIAGTETLTGKTLTSPTINSPTISAPAITDPVLTGTARQDEYSITDGAAFAIDPRNGSIQRVTLGANRTPVAANWNNGDEIILMVAGAGFTVTWTTVAVTWIGGVTPTLLPSGYSAFRLWKTNNVIYGAQLWENNPDWIFVGSTSASGTTGAGATEPSISLTSLTGGIGTAPAAADFVVVAVGAAGTSDLNMAMVTSGYTEDQDLFGNSSSDANLGLYLKVMSGTPDTTVQPSIPSNSGGSYAVAVHVWRNVNPTTQLDVATTTATGTATVLADPAASNAPATGNALVLVAACGAHVEGTATFTGGSYTNLVTVGGNGSSHDATIVLATAAKGPLVAFNPDAFGFSASDSASYSYAAATMVLRRA